MRQKIARLRKRADNIDKIIVGQIARRLGLVKKINTLKKMSRYPLLDARREAVIRKKRQKMAKELAISQDFLERIFKIIIAEGKKFY